MKQLKKALVFLLCALCVLLPCALGAAAEEGGKTVSVLCYNVAGLPNLDALTGKPGAPDVGGNQTQLGRQLNASAYDVIAVQEDFNYHRYLADELKTYPNKTNHTGGVPGGDGLNVFSRVPVYNETRTTWEQLYGVIDDGADEMTPKGILYTVLDFGDGILVDLYDIHADAYGDPGSCAARRDNFRQLAEAIKQRGTDRPVIVTGDFNASLFNDNSLLKETLVDGCGLKDAWVQVKNGGNYSDCSYFSENYGDHWTAKWGVWDSVERFMYKDGGGISLACTAFEYVDVLNSKGESCSDHMACEASFTYTVNSVSENIGEGTAVVENNGFAEMLRRIVTFFQKLILGIRNFDKVRAYFGF